MLHKEAIDNLPNVFHMYVIAYRVRLFNALHSWMQRRSDVYSKSIYNLFPIFTCIVTHCDTLTTFSSFAFYKRASYVPYRQLFDNEFGGIPTIYDWSLLNCDSIWNMSIATECIQRCCTISAHLAALDLGLR